jgi:hypothetical protein
MRTLKKITLSFITILVLLASSSFYGSDKNKKIPPPGTIELRDNLFIDAKPIYNIHYLEYEYGIRYVNFNLTCFENYVSSLPKYGAKDSAEILRTSCESLKDSNSLKIDNNIPISWNFKTDFYLRHPRYNFYPCVNISYQIASAYCKWRTQVVMLSMALTANSKSRERSYSKILYRLPTKEEWKYALDKFKDNTATIYTGRYDSACYVAWVDFKDKKNFYRLSNISEMVQQEGVAVGANWKDSSSYGIKNFTTHYLKSSDWLGFRCICEVEK